MENIIGFLSRKPVKKILSWILIFALIFGQLSAPLAVLAEEASSSAAPQPTQEASNSAQPSPPTPTPISSATPSATPSAEPAEPDTATESARPNQQRRVKWNTKNYNYNPKKSYVEGEVLVKFRRDQLDLRKPEVNSKITTFEDKHSVEIENEIKDANIALVTSDQSTETLLNDLKKDPTVERVEPNYLRYPTAIPNDPKFNELWGLNNIGQSVNGISGAVDNDLDAPEAWDLESDSQPDIIVAVIDTGVAYNHPDLAANMWNGTNCKDDSGTVISGGCPNHGWDFQHHDNNPADDAGHGTHVAGTIAAVVNNNKGVAGLSIKNNIKIMALKVGDGKGFGLDAIVKAINFAKQNGAKVINASYGAPYFSAFEEEAIKSFPGLFIAAAGNANSNNDVINFAPAGYNNPNIIAVAALNQNNQLASFSNYGATTVDVAAPGTNIVSTYPVSADVHSENFNSVTPPNVPGQFTKIGDWETFNIKDLFFGNVLYADSNIPYLPNAQSNLTSPTINLSGVDAATIGFYTSCDTEYVWGWRDYMTLEVSGDGSSYTEIARWDEIEIDDDQNPDNEPPIQRLYFSISNNQYLTGNFKYRFNWITNASNHGTDGLGCFIDSIAIFKYSKDQENYTNLAGTSMATPHVAGEAAMIMSYKPSLTTALVKDTILNSGDPLPALVGKTVSGKRINLNNALRYTPQSSNADLSNLTISQEVLTPSFSPSIASYSTQVANNVTSIKVTPTVADNKSTVKVNGVNVVSGSPSADINLNVGNNFISIVVTAENQTTKTYTINIVRAAPDITAPIITITKSPNKNIHNGPYTMTVNFDDAVTKKYKIDSGNLTDYTQAVTVSIEGQHTFYAEGIDSAGNRSSAQVTFEIDLTAPRVVITKTPNKDISNSSYTLSVNYSDANTKEYRVNNGNWNQYIGDVTISSEDSYTFEARGTDEAGNQITSQATFTIDKTSPIISITSPAAAARVSGISVLQFTVNEQTEVKCSLDNHVFKKCSSGDIFTSLDLFNNFIDGPFTLYMQAEDGAGNIGTTDRGFIKDTYIPLAPGTPSSQAGPLINNQEYSFGFAVDIPLPNDVKPNHLIKIYLNTDQEFISDTITQNYISTQKYTFAVSKDSLGADGTKIFTARIIDHLGRLSPLSNPLTLTLDTKSPAAPTITSAAQDDKINALEQSQVEIKGQTEALSLVKISLTDQVSTKSATIKLSGSQIDYGITVDAKDLNDGNITVTSQAEDEAGNSSAVNYLTVVKDTKVPTLTSVSIRSNNIKPTKAKLGDTITLQFIDSEDLKDPQVSIHESTVVVSKNGNVYTASRKVEATDNEMVVTFEINYEDVAGNKGVRVNTTTDSSSVTTDKTAPALQQVTAITSPTNDNTPDYVFSSTEAGTTTYSGGCSSSQTVAQAGNNTITFNTLADGTYNNCTILVADDASNISQGLKVNTFTVDTVAPAGTLVINSGSKYTNSKQLTLTLTNASLDIAKVQIAEGEQGSFGSPIAFSSAISYSLQDGSEGQKTIKVKLIDAAGNIGEETGDTVVLDTAAPTISNLILTNKTTGNNLFVKNGDVLELSATLADTHLADILSSDIKANLSAVGGQAQTNPTSFAQSTGIATWKNIMVFSTSEGFIKITVNAKDQAGNAATAEKSVEADNSVPLAKTDYFTTTKNTSILISSALVLANDTDLSGDILLVTQGADFIFTPKADFIGTTILSYTITDGANFAIGTIYITVTPDLEDNEKTLQPVTELGPQDKKVVVVDTPFESTVNVPSGSTDVTLDLTNVITANEEKKTAALTGKINVNVADKNLGNLSLQLPETVSISGPVTWNGAIKVPTVLDNSTFTATPAAGMTASTTAVVEVGSEDAKLSLSKAARLVIPGKKGSLAAFSQAGLVTPIATICSSDDQTSADSLPQKSECKIDVGSDLVIWTKHFTKFATYTETAIPSNPSQGSSSTPSSAGSSNPSSPSNPSNPSICIDTQPGSAPTLLQALATAPNQVTLTWSKAKDPVTYYLVAYGTKSGTVEFGNPNVGDKDTTSYIVNGLSGKTTYYFKVRAGNNCMPGQFSNEIGVTAYGKSTFKAAEGFSKGVLSTSKTDSSFKIINSTNSVKPSNNMFNLIKNFLFRLFRLTNKTS